MHARVAAEPALEGSAAGERYRVQFTATAGEYFRIWIVNLALSVVTLGIYSAWAKVRKKRYFYAHTQIAGEGFEYRGSPVAILKGRLIAVGLLAVYAIGGHISPLLQGVLGITLALAFPWFFVRSLAFNAHNSAYRNIRFHFDGTYGAALKLMAGCGLLLIVTLGLGYPYVKARLLRFSAEHHRYGTAPFALPSLTGRLYIIYAKLLGWVLLGALIAGVGMMVLGFIAAMLRGTLPPAVVVPLVGVFTFVAMAWAYTAIFAYPRAHITNALWDNLVIGTEEGARMRFRSELRARDLAWLYFVNVLALVLTLGLATPWAVVRTMRYRAEQMRVYPPGNLDRFVAGQSAEVGASGEELGEMFGFDFSF